MTRNAVGVGISGIATLRDNAAGGGGPVPFDPATLFSGGIGGGYWDFTNAGSLFSDTARTTPATVNGSVRGVSDGSGNGRHLSTTSTTILRRSGYVEFSGLVSAFGSTVGQVGSTNGWTVAAAFRPVTTSSGRHWVDSDVSGARVMRGVNSNTNPQVQAFSTSNVYFLNDSTGPYALGADVAVVNTAAKAACVMRRNKAQVATSAWAMPSMDVAVSNPIGVGGGYGGAAVVGSPDFGLVVGRMYAALFINKVLSAQEIADLETWLYLKAGLS